MCWYGLDHCVLARQSRFVWLMCVLLSAVLPYCAIVAISSSPSPVLVHVPAPRARSGLAVPVFAVALVRVRVRDV